VLRRFRHNSRLRPWIALAAAYALAFQVLLGSFAVGHAQAAIASASDDIFVICYGAGSGSVADDHGAPAKGPTHQPPCLLCTLAKGPLAILPIDHSIATLDLRLEAILSLPSDGPVIPFHSPTGHYQRGPPLLAV
jgi:hypothetical protein